MIMKPTPGDHKHPYTLPLKVPACTAVRRVGAKAARLADMGLHHFPIPDGFVVTTHAFEAFCRHNHLWEKIQTPPYDAALQQVILQAPLPADLEARIDHALKTFACQTFAVRSSAAAEDHSAHSMAGQLDTFLNTPKAHIHEKIKACWASMFSAAVTAYTYKKGVPLSTRMGVIVQEQIQPLLAGVLFTMDPLTQSADHLVLEWVQGLGDKLVSGKVTPRRIFINRQAPGDHPPDHLPPLLAQWLARLSALALKAEKHFDSPLDIEWCLTPSGPTIVQARPITGIQGHDQLLWTNVNMVENFPDALTPFTWSIVDTFYIYYTKHMLKLFGWKDKRLFEARAIVDNLTGIHAGRIYYNLSNWYEAALFLPIGNQLKDLLDSFIGQKVPFRFESGPSNQWQSKGWRRPLQWVLFWIRLFTIFCTAGYHIHHYEKAFYRHRQRWRRSSPYPQRPLLDLLAVLDSIFYDFVHRYYFNPAIVDLLSAIFPGGLKQLTQKWLSQNNRNTDLLCAQLLQGADLKSLQPARMLQTLAKEIAQNPLLQTFLDQKNYPELESRLPAALKALLNDFLMKFGNRCYHDCTMVTPTFEERHDLLWLLVEKYQHATPPSDTQAKQQPRAASPKALKELPLLRRRAFAWVLKQAHRAISLRERSRIIRSLLFGETRQIALAIGHQLTAKGHLADAEEVFYLQWTEIKDLVHGKYQFPETLPALIQLRKQALNDNNQKAPPSFFVRPRSAYFEAPPATQPRNPRHASQLNGIAVSGGIVRARARIITDPINDNRLNPGDILVTRATDPGWTPLFQIAGGLIVERGGMLSHGAIVAREFGIPAVAGIENATTIIQEGQTLIINGDAGRVTLIDPNKEAP
jgi:phosphohistidine swiveling domain-containing protein